MSRILDTKRRRRLGRKARVRGKVRGTAEKPRVTVSFTNRNVIAQMIDDTSGRTLAFVSTMGAGAGTRGKNMAAARWAGVALAEAALGLGIKSAVFDRNGRVYHGKVREIADAMREKGISM
ncbi:MAG: 50S ribosomal protein L18 [Candidatus Nitrospinota bacterium M3_3B_026]